LLEVGEPGYAGEVLRRWSTEIADAEPSFRLYYGVLLNRAGDDATKFRVLNALFNENPDLIARSSLRLYYPSPSREIQDSIPTELNMDPMLILSLIRQESGFNEKATSPAGAMGLMQLMPQTALTIEAIEPRALYEPGTNVRVGSKYFKQLLEKYEGDVELSLAAYNAGPHRVDDWKRRYPVADRLLFLDMIPFRETRDYVASIARNYFWYRSLYKKSQVRASQRASVTPGFRLFD
jgi:soluble lytic murein transglycosylase